MRWPWGDRLSRRGSRQAEPCLPPKTYLALPVDGLMVRATVMGAGPPVVLVHGLGTSGDCWTHNVDALAACSRLYIVDLPGFGDSDTPSEILAPDRLAERLARWCLAQDLQHASFIGHSLGGEVCMWLAATYPTMVDRLVLAASTGASPHASLPGRLGRLVIDGLREPLSVLPTLVSAYVKAGPRRMLGTILASDTEALARRLAGIHAETLVVWGARDPVIPLEEARELAGAIPRGRLAVIEEGAHGLIFDAPERFNQLVCGFLSASECPLP